MDAVVVHWKVTDELDYVELSIATNWVIQTCLEKGLPPQVFFSEPSYPHLPRRFKGDTVMSSTGWFAIVVTNEPITREQANAIMADFYEEDDARGIPYRK